MRWEKIPESVRMLHELEWLWFRDSASGGSFRRDPCPLRVPCRVLETSREAARVLHECFRGLRHEELWVLGMDDECRATKAVRVAVGSEGRVEASTSLVVLAVAATRSTAFVLAHNHPEGDPRPSPADWIMTKAVLDAADACGLELVDHLVIGDGVYASLRSLNEPMFIEVEGSS